MNKFYELLKTIKFEYILILVVLGILSGVIFANIELTESANAALLAIIALLSASSGFMFGMAQVSKEK